MLLPARRPLPADPPRPAADRRRRADGGAARGAGDRPDREPVHLAALDRRRLGAGGRRAAAWVAASGLTASRSWRQRADGLRHWRGRRLAEPQGAAGRRSRNGAGPRQRGVRDEPSRRAAGPSRTRPTGNARWRRLCARRWPGQEFGPARSRCSRWPARSTAWCRSAGTCGRCGRRSSGSTAAPPASRTGWRTWSARTSWWPAPASIPTPRTPRPRRCGCTTRSPRSTSARAGSPRSAGHLTGWLTGEVVQDHANASSTLLYDIESRAWSRRARGGRRIWTRRGCRRSARPASRSVRCGPPPPRRSA